MALMERWRNHKKGQQTTRLVSRINPFSLKTPSLEHDDHSAKFRVIDVFFVFLKMQTLHSTKLKNNILKGSFIALFL